MGILFVPSAFGSDFSDIWLDDSNAENGIVYVVGAGVTDGDYTADAIDVETTLTSPNGRIIMGDAVGYAAARAEIRLLWDWNDFGEFSLQSVHQPYCSDGGWGRTAFSLNTILTGME